MRMFSLLNGKAIQTTIQDFINSECLAYVVQVISVFVLVIAWFGGQLRINFLSKILRQVLFDV